MGTRIGENPFYKGSERRGNSLKRAKVDYKHDDKPVNQQTVEKCLNFGGVPTDQDQWYCFKDPVHIDNCILGRRLSKCDDYKE